MRAEATGKWGEGLLADSRRGHALCLMPRDVRGRKEKPRCLCHFEKNMQVGLLGLGSAGLALACAGERKTKLATVGYGKKLA